MTRSTTQPTSNKSYAPSMVSTLRALMPKRPLSFGEAKRIADLQAARLLRMTESTSAPVSEAVITELPRVAVERVGNLIGSGMSAWSRGSWQIRLNAGEPLTRQRFTLAHELKHILDAACEDVIYRHLPDGPARQRHIEAVCDHFAACLLMPTPWVKKLWGEGIQDLGGLAWRFEVSQQAMLIRLQYLGLVDPIPRHAVAHRLGSLAVRGSRRNPHRRIYRRSASPTSGRPYTRTASFPISRPVLQGVSP